jgi:hypothetical protein
MTSTNITMATGGGGGSNVSGYGTYGTLPPTSTVTVTGAGTSYPITGNPQIVTIGATGSSSGVGSFLTSTSSGPIWSNNLNNANIKITGNNPMLSTDKNEIDLDELADTMRILRERFLIIIPDFEKHEKYAALKKAYDHYKLLEAMIKGEKK